MAFVSAARGCELHEGCGDRFVVSARSHQVRASPAHKQFIGHHKNKKGVHLSESKRPGV